MLKRWLLFSTLWLSVNTSNCKSSDCSWSLPRVSGGLSSLEEVSALFHRKPEPLLKTDWSKLSELDKQCSCRASPSELSESVVAFILRRSALQSYRMKRTMYELCNVAYELHKGGIRNLWDKAAAAEHRHCSCGLPNPKTERLCFLRLTGV